MDRTNLFRRCVWAVLLSLTVSLSAVALGQNADAFALVLQVQTGQKPTAPVLTVPTENTRIPTEITQPTAPRETEPEAVVSFSPGDLELLDISNLCGAQADAAALLCGSLDWDLTGSEPTVLILHTHTTEAYADTYDRENCRTRDETGNMLAIGEEMARVLALGGIYAIHDRTVHDDPDYNGAYAAARQTIQGYLQRYPTILLVLDLHRDASSGETPLLTAATVDGQKSAQLMLVQGSNFAGWEYNFALALKLSALLEREDPGITRPVSLRSKGYNQDLCPGSLLVEVGAAGNTLQEAKIAANALARAIITLAKGNG